MGKLFMRASKNVFVTTGFVKKEPADREFSSAVSRIIDFFRLRAITAARTDAGVRRSVSVLSSSRASSG
jgi:hypothetical protein